ncbi:MAG TPA: HisA/HisF-related TIM barrel protein [Taishania sp.]|nr:HisA/HisF-related TIM barrel protein [Taishania sp.]
MNRPRIIPVLLLQNGGLVKSIQFKNHQYIGDPINAVKLFNDLKADELVLLDIDATKEGRSISLDLVKQIGEEANMPFSVGGGIKDIATIQQLIQAGAERVIINTAAFEQPNFIKEASSMFGTSTISVCIDYKRTLFRKEFATIKGGTTNSSYSLMEAVAFAANQGAGEIIVQSIEKDGTMSGFDCTTLQKINDSVSIPVVALGGGGSKSDFESLYQATPLNGIAAGSYFVFQGKLRGVLIQYPPVSNYTFAQ